MTEYISGIPVRCPKCFSSGVANVTRYVWWVNQYGAKVRVFCHVCGAVTDKKMVRGEMTNETLNWQIQHTSKFDKNGDLPF